MLMLMLTLMAHADHNAKCYLPISTNAQCRCQAEPIANTEVREFVDGQTIGQLTGESSTDRQLVNTLANRPRTDNWSTHWQYVDGQTIGQLTGTFVDGQTIGQLTGEFADGQTIGKLTGEFVE